MHDNREKHRVKRCHKCIKVLKLTSTYSKIQLQQIWLLKMRLKTVLTEARPASFQLSTSDQSKTTQQAKAKALPAKVGFQRLFSGVLCLDDPATSGKRQGVDSIDTMARQLKHKSVVCLYTYFLALHWDISPRWRTLMFGMGVVICEWFS